MFEYIVDYALKAAGKYTKRKQTKLILLHHTSGGEAETVQGIHAYHLSRGHKGIDYNICVEKNGTVAWGRGLDACGGSVNNSNIKTKGMNDDSIAIVALGNFEQQQMTESQKAALKRVVKDVVNHYEISEIKGHYEVAGRDYTDCPGQYFPINEVREYALSDKMVNESSLLKDAIQPPSKTPIPTLVRNLKLTQPLMRGDDVRMAQERLVFHKAQPGKADGIFGEKTKAAVLRFQTARIKEGYDLGSAGADGVIGHKTWRILWE